jgi:hypothetical protein
MSKAARRAGEIGFGLCVGLGKWSFFQSYFHLKNTFHAGSWVRGGRYLRC